MIRVLWGFLIFSYFESSLQSSLLSIFAIEVSLLFFRFRTFNNIIFVIWVIVLKFWSFGSISELWKLRNSVSLVFSSRRRKHDCMLVWNVKLFGCAFVAIIQVRSHGVSFSKVLQAKLIPISVMINSFWKVFKMLTLSSCVMISNR